MSLVNALFPVICIAALGYLARHRHWLSESEASVLERLSFSVLVPCLLFRGAATAVFPARLPWDYLGAFYLVVAVGYLGTMLLGHWRYRYSLRELSIFGMAAGYANATVLGIPITLAVLGETALVPMLVIICVHNLVIFSFGTVLAEWSSPPLAAPAPLAASSNLPSRLLTKLWRVATELVLNPISGSLLAGALLNSSGVPLPTLVERTLGLLAGAAIPGAVFGLGTSLVRYRLSGELGRTLLVVALKLLLLPALMWVVMVHWLAIEALWASAAVMIAAMPTGISVYVFARRYGCCEAVAANAIVLSTLLAVFTLSGWAWWLQSGLS